MKNIKFLRRFIGFTLAGAMIFSSVCFAEDKKNSDDTQTTTQSDRSDSQTDKPSEAYSGDIHTTKLSDIKKIASSGLLEMYFDGTSYCVVIKDTLNNKIWTSLPASLAKKDTDCSVITAYVFYKNEVYSLNSQDDCVKLSAADTEKIDNGVKVIYKMSKSVGDGEISLELAVCYTLADGSFYVDIDCSGIAVSNGARLLKLDVMKSFGATAQSNKDDFILVPDGAGAIIKTGVEDKSVASLDFAVYGGLLDGEVYENTAVIPAFGMKQGNTAFAALIEQGDALAVITAKRADNGDTGYNQVGANFTITEKDGQNNVSSVSYKGHIKICYRFISGSNAGYVGMAIVCREQLIRNGVLSTKRLESSEYMPVTLNVTGQSESPKKILGIFKKNLKLTEFEQALDVVTLLKAKGVNNMTLRYKGALSGGLGRSNIFKTKILRSLGGKNGFNELYDYMLAQKQELYLDVDVISSNSFASSKSAQGFLDKKLTLGYSTDTGTLLGIKNITLKFLRLTQIGNAVIKLLNKTEKLGFTGYCLNDMGAMLYSDNTDGATRQDIAAELSEQAKIASMNRKLMVDTGNFYCIKNADYIVDLDTEVCVKDDSAYVGVPFVPVIWHGIFDYSAKPVNMYEDYKTALLKSVEYGAIPSFELIYRDDDGYFSKINYENWTGEITDFYTKANKSLNDLRNSKISGHYTLQDGVYCTEFDNGAKIYVNYTQNSVTVSKFSVPPMSFIRIN